jgi:adenylate kinase family enzyme
MNTNLISSHVIFLHGLSGAGKSVLQKSLEETLSSSGFAPLYLSSGDCFRALAELDPELAKKMSQGNFIQTLEGTMPLLKKTIQSFLSDLEENKKPVLILDGFLRLPRFEADGKIIPSQVNQVGEAFPIENAADEIVRKGWHCYVDVNDTDAEALMRIRSEKHLKVIIELIDNLKNKTEKIDKLKELLNKAYEIQSNEKYRLKAVPENLHEEFDKQMEKIIGSVFELVQIEYKEGMAISKPIQEIIGEKVTLRDDDLTFKRRLKRISEFNVNTKEGMLIKELGFKYSDNDISTEQDGRLCVIKNGPSIGVTLEELSGKCINLADNIIYALKSTNE